jgi:hypothetical protein
VRFTGAGTVAGIVMNGVLVPGSAPPAGQQPDARHPHRPDDPGFPPKR